LISCSSAQDPADILFEDSIAGNWQENWFLNGKKAVLEHRDGGLAFITGNYPFLIWNFAGNR